MRNSARLVQPYLPPGAGPLARFVSTVRPLSDEPFDALPAQRDLTENLVYNQSPGGQSGHVDSEDF